MVWWGWFGSRDGVRGASLEGICVGAIVQHNMERGEFDFEETQTPGMGSGSQACVNAEELMGSEGSMARGIGPELPGVLSHL